MAQSGDGSVLYVCGSATNIFQWKGTWSPTSFPIDMWKCIATDTTGSNVYACGSGNLYSSHDSGKSNQAIGPLAPWTSIACDPTGRIVVACADQDYVYVSTNAGATWNPKGSKRAWRGVSYNATSRCLAAVAYNDHVYVSTNMGTTWKQEATADLWTAVVANRNSVSVVGANTVIVDGTDYEPTTTTSACG